MRKTKLQQEQFFSYPQNALSNFTKLELRLVWHPSQIADKDQSISLGCIRHSSDSPVIIKANVTTMLSAETDACNRDGIGVSNG